MYYFLTHFFFNNFTYVKGVIKVKTNIWNMKDYSQDPHTFSQLAEIKLFMKMVA